MKMNDKLKTLKMSDRIMLKVGSIQGFLIITISILFSLYLSASYILTKEQTKHEIDELFDPQLAHSAFLLFDLLAESIANIDQQSEYLPVIYHNFSGENTTGNNQNSNDVDSQDTYIYENKFAYQVFNNQHKLLIKSSSAPDFPFANRIQGYSKLTIKGDVWRIYSLYDPDGGFWLYVSENESVRDELSEDIIEKILLPKLVVFPLLILLLIVVIRLGLSPLKQLVLGINRRDENSLKAITLDVVPKELNPVVDSINGLITRIDSALNREKQLTADTAHELRTPLAVVLIHAQNALNNHSENERNNALVELDKGVNRVARLLEQLLTLSKINADNLPKTSICFHQLTQDVMAEMAVKMIKKNQDLSLVCDPQCQKELLPGSEFLLEILIRNLLDNASQYTPEKGEIKLTLSLANNDYILKIEDSGIGIDEALYTRLTDRFYRQHQQLGKGAGLGLTLVNNIVEYHHGVLSFEASELGGLAVIVSLPLFSDNV
tara:strand:- start:6827 stop:8302 length:1476 start_codon:yes stop_codon:yes gene_type:complete